MKATTAALQDVLNQDPATAMTKVLGYIQKGQDDGAQSRMLLFISTVITAEPDFLVSNPTLHSQLFVALRQPLQRCDLDQYTQVFSALITTVPPGSATLSQQLLDLLENRIAAIPSLLKFAPPLCLVSQPFFEDLSQTFDLFFFYFSEVPLPQRSSVLSPPPSSSQSTCPH